MPAIDVCHSQVVHALQKDGWTVDERPQHFATEERVVFIDIEAVRAENGNRFRIFLAEIKCFTDPAVATRDLYISIGQYLIYRAMLDELGSSTPLYLALPHNAYESVFDSTARRAIHDNRIKMVIVNVETETVERWIE